jgi:hypothetical protein
MARARRLLDEYRFPGFQPKADIRGVFGDSKARIIQLQRSQKKRYAAVAEQVIGVITTRRQEGYGIYPAGMRGYIWKWKCAEFRARHVGK